MLPRSRTPQREASARHHEPTASSASDLTHSDRLSCRCVNYRPAAQRASEPDLHQVCARRLVTALPHRAADPDPHLSGALLHVHRVRVWVRRLAVVQDRREMGRRRWRSLSGELLYADGRTGGVSGPTRARTQDDQREHRNQDAAHHSARPGHDHQTRAYRRRSSSMSRRESRSPSVLGFPSASTAVPAGRGADNGTYPFSSGVRCPRPKSRLPAERRERRMPLPSASPRPRPCW